MFNYYEYVWISINICMRVVAWSLLLLAKCLLCEVHYQGWRVVVQVNFIRTELGVFSMRIGAVFQCADADGNRIQLEFRSCDCIEATLESASTIKHEAKICKTLNHPVSIMNLMLILHTIQFNQNSWWLHCPGSLQQRNHHYFINSDSTKNDPLWFINYLFRDLFTFIELTWSCAYRKRTFHSKENKYKSSPRAETRLLRIHHGPNRRNQE